MKGVSGWMDEFESSGGGSSRKSTKGQWMYMEGAPNEGNTYRVRFLSAPDDTDNPYKFFAHYTRVPDGKDADGKTKWKQQDFPDHEKFNRSKRVCTDPHAQSEGRESKCPWCQLGYQRSVRWLSLLIDRQSGEVKYYEMPKSVYDGVKMWWKKNFNDFPGGPGSLEDEATDFDITLIIGGMTPKYVCQPGGRIKRLTDDDLAAIAAFNSDAKTEDEKYALPDLSQVIRPSYMDNDIQERCFNGKIIQPNPYEKKGENIVSAPVEDFEKEEDVAPVVVATTDDDDWGKDETTDDKFGGEVNEEPQSEKVTSKKSANW